MKVQFVEEYPGELRERAHEIPTLLKGLDIKPVQDHDRRHSDRYKFKAIRDMADNGTAEYKRLMGLLVSDIEKVMATDPEDFKPVASAPLKKSKPKA